MMPSEVPAVLRGSRGYGSGIKKSKPAMEKRRRARINASLAELRSLIPESVKRGNRRCSKMEKADILELAVLYLRHLQDANTDKGQVSKTSYSLGFNECTQEVSEFFRSTSPATSSLKGSLLEHLNGCAPDTSPDSPSTSAAKSAPTSTNSFFKTSSIIARCLLSSTMVVTPKKISGYARHSSTPTAVSSSSDADSSQASLDAAQSKDDDNYLETDTELTKPDGNEASHVQRLEIFKVKKDLISSFNNEPKEHQNSYSRPANYITSNNVDQLSKMPMVQDDTELDDSGKQQNSNDAKHVEETSFPIIVNPGETTTTTAANVCSLPSSPETKESLVDATLFDKQDEQLQSKGIAPFELATTNVQSLSQTIEKTDDKTGNGSTDANNTRNSYTSTTEATEIQQINSPSAAECGDFDSVSPGKLPITVQESSSSPTISQNTDNCTRNRTIDVQTLAYTRPVELSSAEPACSDTDDAPQTGAASQLQQASISVAPAAPRVSDNSCCSQETTSRICVTMDDSSDIMPNIPSLLKPAYNQSSLQKETLSFQQAIIIKSPNKTNSVVPALLATSASTTSTVNEQITADSCVSNRKDIASSDVQLCDNKILDSPLQLLPFIPKQNNIFLKSSIASDLECQTDSQADITENNTISSLKMAGNTESSISSFTMAGNTKSSISSFTMAGNTESSISSFTMAGNTESSISSFTMAGNKESILPTVISPGSKENISNMKGNNTLKTNKINSVASNAKTHNVPILLFNAVNLANFTSVNRKRPLQEADALDEKSDGRNKSPSQNSDNAKKIRLNPTILPQPATYQDSGSTNETLRQYMVTKFRPIAPKNVDIQNVESEDFGIFQQQGNSNQISVKQVPSKNNNNNNVFTSVSRTSSILCQKSNMKTGKEQVPDHHSSTFSGNMNKHQCDNAQPLSMKASAHTSVQADDILTTVLKSSIPLDKTLFEARRLNTSKLIKHGSFAEPLTSNKQQNEYLQNRQLHDTHIHQNSVCQSNNNNNKSPRQSNTFKDQVFVAQLQKQICELEEEEVDDGVPQIKRFVNDNNILLDPPGKHPHYNVSAILREFCHRCQLSDSSPKPNISGVRKCVSPENKHDHINRPAPNLSRVSPQHVGDSEMTTEKWNSTPIDLTINQQSPVGNLLHEEELGTGHFSFTELSHEIVAASDNGRTSTKNEHDIPSNDFRIHIRHAVSTNSMLDILDSPLTQPLDLSLRDNGETKTLIFPDKESVDSDYSPGLDLSFSHCRNTTSTFHVSQSSSPSQIYCSSDNEHYSPTTKPHTHANIQAEHKSQWKGVYQTNLTESNNLPSLCSSISFSQNKQTTGCKPSPNKIINLNQEIKTESRSYMHADVDIWSRSAPMSASSGKTGQLNEYQHCTENIQYSPRPFHTGGCSPDVHQNCHLPPERSITTTLPSLRHIYHSPGETAGTGDDVWRPW